jgi:hypothetical protein
MNLRCGFVLVGLAAFAVLEVCAQDSRRTVSDEQTTAMREARRSAWADAATLAHAGDLDGAEEIVADLTTARPGSAQWHMELGREFTHIALRLSGKAPEDTVVAAARRAVNHLQRADALTTDVRMKAGARNLCGFLFERFLGDVQAARASYHALLEVAPGSRGTAERISRLDTAEKNAARTDAAGRR